MTKRMHADARHYFERIEELGGMLAALEKGFFRREIADAAFVYQREVDAKRKLIVGVNAFTETDEKPLDVLVIDDKPERDQVAALRSLKAKRENESVRRSLDAVRRAAGTKENLLPVLIDAARVRCTVGELMAAMADVFGRYDGAAKW
jgi:methylmalonyl-CoA mutase N-terminal domain/subunit